MANVKAIPDGYQGVTPYLIVRGASRAIEFYKRAFGAKELTRMPMPDGRIGHAELAIGNGRIMLADENPEWQAKSPQLLGGSPVGLAVYVEGVDKFVETATAAGAAIERPLQDQFYGDRSATLRDPFGHQWTIAQHIEDVSPAEMAKRMAAMPKPS